MENENPVIRVTGLIVAREPPHYAALKALSKFVVHVDDWAYQRGVAGDRKERLIHGEVDMLVRIPFTKARLELLSD